MLKGLNDFLDKHEGRKVGSSTKAILQERKRQGYGAKHKALEGMKHKDRHLHILGKGYGTVKSAENSKGQYTRNPVLNK